METLAGAVVRIEPHRRSRWRVLFPTKTDYFGSKREAVAAALHFKDSCEKLGIEVTVYSASRIEPRQQRELDLIWRKQANGGFAARVIGTNIVAYAYPSSEHARDAASRPGETAVRMIREEMEHLRWAVEVRGYEAVRDDAQHVIRVNNL